MLRRLEEGFGIQFRNTKVETALKYMSCYRMAFSEIDLLRRVCMFMFGSLSRLLFRLPKRLSSGGIVVK